MLKISSKRTSHFHRLFAEIGSGCNHSVTRLGYSNLESQAHQKYADLILQIPGWVKSVDVFGNTHFTLSGRDLSLPPIRIGSHLDSVNQAGLFDGTSGCIAGLLIAEYLYNNGISLNQDLVISLWRCEESTRFGAAMVGSRLFCGLFTMNSLNQITDSSGISLLGGMLSQGLDKNSIQRELKKWQVPATGLYAEMHIEQGPELYESNADVGIVTGFCGTWRAEVEIKGRKDHSSRKRNARKDAMEAAMYAGAQIYALVSDYQEYPVVTIGGLYSNGSMNCIAGNVKFTVDIRGLQARQLQTIAAKIKRIVASSALVFNVDFDIHEKGLVKPVGTSRSLQRKLVKVAEDNRYNYQLITSGAGHDAMSFALAGLPSIMVFAPSSSRRVNGAYSHSPDEFASSKKLAGATGFLLQSILSF